MAFGPCTKCCTTSLDTDKTVGSNLFEQARQSRATGTHVRINSHLQECRSAVRWTDCGSRPEAQDKPAPAEEREPSRLHVRSHHRYPRALIFRHPRARRGDLPIPCHGFGDHPIQSGDDEESTDGLASRETRHPRGRSLDVDRTLAGCRFEFIRTSPARPGNGGPCANKFAPTGVPLGGTLDGLRIATRGTGQACPCRRRESSRLHARSHHRHPRALIFRHPRARRGDLPIPCHGLGDHPIQSGDDDCVFTVITGRDPVIS